MKVTKIKLGRGLSAEIDGNWHKLYCEMEAELDKDDTRDEVRQRLWDNIDNVLEKKVDGILSS